MFRESWWPIWRKFCNEVKLCLVSAFASSPGIRQVMWLTLIRRVFTWVLLPKSKGPWMSIPAALDTKASNLSSLSKKYRSDAKYLNTRSTYAKVAAVAVVFITLIVYVRFWWLWWRQDNWGWAFLQHFAADPIYISDLTPRCLTGVVHCRSFVYEPQVHGVSVVLFCLLWCSLADRESLLEKTHQYVGQ